MPGGEQGRMAFPAASMSRGAAHEFASMVHALSSGDGGSALSGPIAQGIRSSSGISSSAS